MKAFKVKVCRTHYGVVDIVAQDAETAEKHVLDIIAADMVVFDEHDAIADIVQTEEVKACNPEE